MRSTLHKLLTSTLLATYASIALLGHGLHWLTPDDGHHHHGLTVVTCSAHHTHAAECCEHQHAGHGDSHEDSSNVPTVTAGSATDCHNCEICEFLIHAVSDSPQVVTTPDLHTLVADLPCQPQGLYSPATLGLHSARGPPQLGA